MARDRLPTMKNCLLSSERRLLLAMPVATGRSSPRAGSRGTGPGCLELVAQPVGQPRRLGEQHVQPLQHVLVVDRVLRRGRRLAEQLEDDRVGLAGLARVFLLLGRRLVGREPELARARLAAETDLVERRASSGSKVVLRKRRKSRMPASWRSASGGGGSSLQTGGR